MGNRTWVPVSADDVWGRFDWVLRPQCRCGGIARAVEDGLVFVSEALVGEGESQSNRFYMLPVQGDGFFALNEGIAIACCPWCGDRIVGRRGPAR